MPRSGSSRTRRRPRTCSRTRPDGVVVSNGPGDPAALDAETRTVGDLLGRVPLLGICLGHQLLARAAGYETFKLRFGHRGANHPVLEAETGRVLVTAQNHGFAVRDRAKDTDRVVTHLSLYDGTVEGLALPDARARSVQFHPEGRSRPARRPPPDRALGGGAQACRVEPISTRSA